MEVNWIFYVVMAFCEAFLIALVVIDWRRRR